MRTGLGAHTAMLPEETSDALDVLQRCHCRRYATREIVVVLGDEPVSDRAPIVDMWIKLPAGTAPRSSRSGPPGTSRPRPARRRTLCGATPS